MPDYRKRRRGWRVGLSVLVTVLAAATPSVAYAATTAGPALAAGVTPHASTRPNILLINTDDQRWDTMNFLPKTMGWMWNARNFDRFQVAIPSCCPSRADLFSGRYPHNDGVEVQSQAQNLDMTATLQEYLHNAGYRTAMAGKFLNSWPQYTAPPSFDKYAYIKGGYLDYYADLDGAHKHIVRTDAAPRNYSTLWLSDQLRGYLRTFATTTPDQPWFAYYAPYAPHADPATGLATPEPKYASAATGNCLMPNEVDRSDKPPYVRWLSYQPDKYTAICQAQIRTLFSVDDAVDGILGQIRNYGQLANTIVVFTSDNGYLWGEHGRNEKFVPYLESVRVPMLMRWNGHITAGVDHRIATTVDIMPTLLSLAGVSVPAGKPALDGHSMFGTPRTTVYTEYFYDSVNSQVPTWSALYTGTQHYIETYTQTGTLASQEYYDLTNDPLEDKNLLHGTVPPAIAAIAAAMHTQLTAARTCSGAACPQ